MHWTDVRSAANPRLKELARLRSRRDRRKVGAFLVEGFREAERALDAGRKARYLLLSPDLVTDEARGLRLAERAAAAGAELLSLSPAAFSLVSMREQPDGALLVAETAERRPDQLPLSGNALAVVVDGLEKPGNVGALLRTADGAGVDALFVTGSGADGGGTDLENPNVIRASMGSVFGIPTASGTRDQVDAALRAAGLRVVVATPDAPVTYWDADLTAGVALVLGAEHDGVPKWWTDRADASVSIPMLGLLADSLNVSVAGALVMYEAVRQRSPGTATSGVPPLRRAAAATGGGAG